MTKQKQKQFLKDNKGKSGIYLFTNKINGKQYVGSAVDLSKRLSHYFSLSNMKIQLKRGKSQIYSAILKYGLDKFSLSIVEYCEPEQCIEREDYFIKSLVPKYNIIQDPTIPPMTGRRHSEETIKKMSSRTHSDETRKKMSDAHKGLKAGENHPLFGKPRAEGAGKLSQKVEVFDKKTNLTTTFNSISEAALTLNINFQSISQYITRNQVKPYKGRYVFTKF